VVTARGEIVVNVTVVTARELTADLRGLWSTIRAGRPDLASPYFTPEFVAAADSCRYGVRVGVIEDGGRPIGFLPFELRPFGIGGPVGGRLSDFQAPIVPAGVALDPAWLVARCGLRLLRFDHLLPDASGFERSTEITAGSPVVDLGGGFDRYYSARPSTTCIDRVVQKARRLRRVHRDVTFEYDCRENAVLDQVIAWKRQQCRRTGVVDFLAQLPNVDLLRAIHHCRTPAFAGVLSVLRVDGRIAAAHFGMRSQDTLHHWFPAYEHDLAAFSPGLVLLLDLLKSAAAAGLVRLDFGKGEEQYKRSFCTHELMVGEGAVAARPVYAWLRRCRVRSVGFLRRSRVAAPLRASVRAVRGIWPRVVATAGVVGGET
jgi:CelD/BcsL family acetyltransferase involved in cellulose biosynthesis